MSRAIVAIIMAVGLLGFGACEEDAQSGSCVTSSECDFGKVCQEESCAELECISDGDCLDASEACVNLGGLTKVCAAVECGCASCGQCPLGTTCSEQGACLADAAKACPNGNSDCGSGQVCGDDGTCRNCVGDECSTTTDCTTDGCETGFTCNTTTGACDADTVTGEQCGTCASADDCGENWVCVPLSSGFACLPPCSTNNDCDTGWLCQSGNCRPSTFKCEGCVVDGCAAGTSCNFDTQACQTAPAACGACSTDTECGAGNACYNNVCVSRCPSGSCSDGGTCVARSDQVSVCDGVCTTPCDPACGGATPFCNDGACVGCRDTDDCTGGDTCTNGVCMGENTGECTGLTPYFLNGSCVECITNDHCNGAFCNVGSNECESDVCASCADPYPACAQIGTDFYCVQCDSDDDCGTGGTCDMANFNCTGGIVSGSGVNCETDADCDQFEAQTGYNLSCSTNLGEGNNVCYDEAGGCDGVAAFCPGTDGNLYECSSLLDLFGSLTGVPGGLPIPGGTTLPGSCGCATNDPLFLGPGSCLSGGSCTTILGLLAEPICLSSIF